MFKVICIDASDDPNCFTGCDVVEGQIYTVVEEADLSFGKNYQLQRQLVYVLAEMGTEWCYDARRFMPLSDVDEMELVNAKKEYA